MPVVRLLTIIRAPVERCFDLSRSIDLHALSTARTRERAVAGVTHGLIGPGEQVTWRAKHLGVWQELTTRITAYDRPRHFRDSMVRGAFKRFDHDHYFEPRDGTPGTAGPVTAMTDVFDFNSPYGWFGRVVDFAFLTRYMHAFLVERNRVIREAAESEQWRQLLAAPPD